MAKKKKAKQQPPLSGEKEKPKKKRGVRKEFLKELYIKDPLISNDKALEKLLAKFPESRADVKAITTWKNILRNEGVEIPKHRQGPKPKPKPEVEETSGKKKKKKKKKTSKRGNEEGPY